MQPDGASKAIRILAVPRIPSFSISPAYTATVFGASDIPQDIKTFDVESAGGHEPKDNVPTTFPHR